MVDKPFEERIFDAIVDRFFEPTVSTSMVVTDSGQPMLNHYINPSPIAVLAKSIYDQHQTRIFEAIKDRIDMDAVVDGVWERIKNEMVQRLLDSSYYSQWRTQQEQLRKRMYELVAEELARRTIAKMDEEAADAGTDVPAG